MKYPKSPILDQISTLGQQIVPNGGHLWLFGSRARGDANADSDWDLLLVMDKPNQEWTDFDKYVYPFTLLGIELGVRINPVMYTQDEWKQRSFTPFYHNVEQEKILIV